MKTGYFGQEYFGAGSYFGAVSSMSTMPLLITPPNFETVFTQSTKTDMSLELKVYKNSTSISSSDVTRFSVSQAENRLSTSASIDASLGSGYAVDDHVQIAICINGAFEILLFSGFVSDIDTNLSSLDDEEAVSISLLTNTGTLSDMSPNLTTWNGMASTLLEYALLQIGCTSTDIDIDDYPLNAVVNGSYFGFTNIVSPAISFNYTTWTDLIRNIVSGVSDGNACVTSSGVGFARSWDHTSTILSDTPSGFVIPRTGWISQTQKTSDAKYRSVTVQGVGTNVYKATHIDGKGIDYATTSNLCASIQACQYKAEALLAISRRITRTIQTPINPLLKIGGLIQIVTVSETVSGKILDIKHSGEWSDSSQSGGYWSSLVVGIDE